MNCLRCGTPMDFKGCKELQMGRTGLITGLWSNILSGSLELNVYLCPNCGKVEFYDPDKNDPYQEETDDK